MKTKTMLLFLPVFILFFSSSVFAGERIVDNAGLLSAEEKAALLYKLNSIAAAYNFDLVIVTEKTIDSMSPMNYADDFFDENGYGFGENKDGCLFLQVTGSRDYWFSTSGRGISILNISAINKLEKEVVPYLSNNDPAAAYRAFIDNWEEFLVLDSKGRSYNIFYVWNVSFVIGAWVLSILIGFITVLKWKAKMNTARPQTQAVMYIVPGSLVFKVKKDSFLYSTVTKTARPKQSSSSGGSHTSSSGRSHGGGGGKY